MSTGADMIAAERQRQIDGEGWTPKHDAEHTGDDLALAAACYALPGRDRGTKRVPREIRESGRWTGVTDRVPRLWPWEANAWKPSPPDRIRELVKAGALIAAEIDRLTPPAPTGETREGRP